MGLFESQEEKKKDVRILGRSLLTGKMDVKKMQQELSNLVDDEAQSTYVNLDELFVKDNPVHIPRGLPTAESQASRQNLEDMEFEAEDASSGNRNFEH